MVNKHNLKKFSILKGRHYNSECQIKLHTGLNSLSTETIFTDSCLYQFDDEDQLDTNKLIGLSYGLHHRNSIRFGWRAENNNIIISLYCYNFGKRSILDICKVNTNIIVDLKFSYDDINQQIVASVNYQDSCHIVTQRFKMPKFKFGYYLWPYFGGNKQAPHEIHIWLKS